MVYVQPLQIQADRIAAGEQSRQIVSDYHGPCRKCFCRRAAILSMEHVPSTYKGLYLLLCGKRKKQGPRV